MKLKVKNVLKLITSWGLGLWVIYLFMIRTAIPAFDQTFRALYGDNYTMRYLFGIPPLFSLEYIILIVYIMIVCSFVIFEITSSKTR